MNMTKTVKRQTKVGDFSLSNLFAIELLECIGIVMPTQQQIDAIEKLIERFNA